MKNHLKTLSIILVLLFGQNLFSQEEKPKVALVLSGGGAKGIAHIPALQMMDSLGIVPDLVIGTSMGSIVGALYAMGYSGDSIASISNHANWDELLGGEVSIIDVSMEERSEFERYIVELEINKGKIQHRKGILDDNNLRDFFNEVTYPAYNIKVFDDLAIPFRAVATDIVNGKVVVLDHGALGFAMRASMSIPGIFAPVEYENTLLVDGGVLNNFPVDIAKEWGANIIIGSDVGGGMNSKEELNDISDLLFQTGMLNSNLKSPESRAMCDILIDHTEYLTYSTGDFNNSKEIIEQGEMAPNDQIEAFVALANKLKKYDQRSIELPNMPDELLMDTIIYKGVSNSNLDMIKARTNFKPHTYYSMPDVVDAVDYALGTNLFDEISYYPFTEEKKLGLRLNAVEKSKHIIKGSLHFDDYRGVGAILNYTGRNLISKSSRLNISIDITEDFKYRVQYQKNFGDRKNWWFRSDFFGENLTQQTFVDGNYADNINYGYYQFDNQINRNINSFNSYIGIGLNYEYTLLSPQIDPEFNENIHNLEEYNFTTFDVYAQYFYHTLDYFYFANRGAHFQVRLARSLYNDMNFDAADESIGPSISGSLQGFTKLSMEFEKRLPLKKNLTAILGAAGGYTFIDDSSSDTYSYAKYGYAAKYFLGGNIVRPRKDNFVLPGLQEDELPATQFTTIDIAAQYNPFNKIYITPHVNLGNVGFGDFNDYLNDFFSADGDWSNRVKTSFVTTAGVTLSYKSILGPVELDVSWVNNVSKTRFFFGVGLFFGRSN